MTAKRLITGLALLLVVCLLSVSLMTSFNHDADAHLEWKCGDILHCEYIGSGTYLCHDVGDVVCHVPH